MATFTVTATEGGSTSGGIALSVFVLTAAAAAQPGQVASATSITPNLAITPLQTGSLVYGALLGLAGTYTVFSANTTTKQDRAGSGLEFIQFRSTNTSTAATPETLGYTATVNGISIALCEVKQAGTLTEDASSPGTFFAGAAITIATAAFTPPAPSLLVAMVSSNGGAAATTMALTDSSGLGLTWTEQVKQNGAGNGYAGVWTAPIPGPAAAVAAVAAVGSDSKQSIFKKQRMLGF